MKTVWKDLLFLHGHIVDPRVLEPAVTRTPEPQPAKVLNLSQGKARPATPRPASGASWRDCA